MIQKLKKLSFNARLVIAMNSLMAMIMVLGAGLLSYKLTNNMEAELDHEVEIELSLFSSVLDRSGKDIKATAENLVSFANTKSVANYVSIKKGGEQYGTSSGPATNSELRKMNAKSDGGFEIEIGYTYDSIEPKKEEALIEIAAWSLLGMLFFSTILYFLSSYFIKPIFAVIEILSNSTSLTTNHADKLKEMSASVQSSGSIINTGSEATTSSMEDLTGTVEESVGELNKCVELADGVNNKADQGTGVMNRLVSSMEVIEEANKKLNELGNIFEEISSKTSVINDIVFKTQLLSFNASIEAARAGQHGRGFSVVAEEIGNLAQMSGKSATEISNLLSSSENHVKNIISGTDEKIAEGRSVSLEALQSFDDIRRDIGEITQSINGVTESSRGQEQAIKETLDTMINLKETVQEQGIYTRSIGKSAQAISDQSSELEKAELRVKKLIYGTAASHSGGDHMDKNSEKMVMHLVHKIKHDKGKAS